MTPEQIQQVQRTWRAVVPIAGQAADIFYDRLFELDERLQPLFSDDLTEQKKKLMAMIGRVVSGLSDADSIVPAIQELGRRHAGYGVRDEDYATVGAALLFTLEKGLGSAWTPEVKESWTAAYTLLSTLMRDAATEHLGARI
jgi:hemoglobin-like flavoprotein